EEAAKFGVEWLPAKGFITDLNRPGESGDSLI
ncbi:hypothetical protein Z557_04108, partial [Mycobacterium tuberculosis 2229BH]